ncbi:hypothetical protein SNE40_015270 [Patella caerulea]|uniref:Uncharacterized protein n=1 Tax=Patella caerulea TaxID=87958 RepID=A0AAN8JJQ3_PATCE
MYLFMLFINCFSSLILEIRSASILGENGQQFGVLSSWHVLVLCIVSSVVVICLAVFVILNCGDCYNSEVGSMNHPASGGSTGTQTANVKWGGSDGYVPQSYGEVVNRSNSNANLPYSAAFSSSPNRNESASFQGFSTEPSAPMVPGGGNRHYNPLLDSQEPPPPYSEFNAR